MLRPFRRFQRRGEGRLNNFSQAYARWVVKWRWVIIPVMVALAALGAYGYKYVGFSDDYRVFFAPENPDLIAHDALQRTYINVDTVNFVLKPKDGSSILTREHLAAIWELTEAAWQIPYTVRVDSLSNYQHTRAEADDLIVEDLVPDPQALDEERVALVREVAMTEPALFKRHISADGTTTSIIATLQIAEDVENVQVMLAPEVHAVAEEFREAHPDLRLAIGGHVMMSTAFFEVTNADVGTLFPLMFLFLAITLMLFLRSFFGALAGMIVVLLSVLAAMGTHFFFGVKLTPVSGSAPVIILTVAVADSIHLLVSMGKAMARGLSKHDAIIESVRINFQPVALTSLTTAIGFLSLNFSDTPPFRDLGNMAATGAVYALILSIVLLPALMAVLPMKPSHKGEFEQRTLGRLVEFAILNPARTLIGVAIVTLGLGVLIPQLELNDKFVEFLSTDIQYRQDSDFISQNLAGIYDIAFSIDSGEPGGIADPDYLERLDRFAEWLESQPEIVHVADFADVMKRLNMNMHGDDPAYYRLPDDQQLAAQYLLLYEMSLPYGLDLNNQINVPKSATKVQATMDNISSSQMKEIKFRAEDWLVENMPPESHSLGSGVTIIFAFLTQRNMYSMTFGTALAIVLISGCLVLALRSLKLGVMSLAPNFLPPIIAFGIWALVVGEIGQYAAMVTATALGMIVDFTVHFLSKYLRARREDGVDVAAGIRYAFNTVGSALWVTAVVLIVGFTVLAFSDFALNANLGIFVALIVAVALVADFLILPAMLMLLERNGGAPPAQATPKETGGAAATPPVQSS